MLKRSFLVFVCVLILFSTALAGVDPSLVGWWKFDEGSGTLVSDSSGRDHHGTIQGTPEWGAGPEGFGPAVGFSDTQGAYCGVFDPTGGTGTFTMALWCNWDGTQSIQHFVTKSNGWGADTAMFQIEVKGGHADSARVDRLHIAYQASPQAVLNLVPHNEWAHLALVFDGTHATGYLNGVDDVGPQPTGIGPNVDAEVIIGASHAAEGRTFQGFLDDVRLYSRTLTAAEVVALMSPVPPGAASDPTPADKATDVPRDISLAWTPGEFAATHDVYLGTVFEDVNAASRDNPMDVLVSENQSDSSYDAGRLDFGQTYYWRIDEVNAPPDSAIYKGAVWSFTVEPLAYPVENVTASSNGTPQAGATPEKTVDGSGLNADDEHSTSANDMWLVAAGADPLWIQCEFDRIYKLHEMLVWNYNVEFELVLGFGLKDVTVEYSADGVDWTVLGDVEFAQAAASDGYVANTTVDFGGAAAKLVRLNVNSGHGVMGQFGLSEVRFMFVPVQAREPQPGDGEAGVPVDTTLAWRAGREAVTHDVYLGPTADALALVETVSIADYTAADLEFGTTYCWRIDEVNEAEAIPVWDGDIWSFSTLAYATIDDMESYDDDENAIFDTWLDGFVNETGSTVGYFNAPFAETLIVNGGSQSMPLEYANDAAPFYSETEYDMGSMDLTANGADTLRLFIAGQADNAAEPLYVALEDTSGNVTVVTHADENIVAAPGWSEWAIPYNDLAAVNLGRVATLYIGIGDRDNPTAGGSGLIFVDDVGFGHAAVVE